jgi:NitT/TauT family transport system permease protein
LFRSIQVPAALPYIFAGLEMGVVYSFIGAVVGEFVGGTEGLGVLILQLNSAMDVSGMFAVLILLAGMGAGSSKILQLIRRRVLYWAPSEQPRDF